LEPRKLHYLMKLSLADFAVRDFQSFFKAFSPPQGRENLKELWNKVAESLPRGERFPFGGSTATHPMANGGVLLVLTMPLPAAPNEAYFLAVVPGPGEGGVVIALERSQPDAAGRPTTMMIGFTASEGGMERINFGPGPQPNREAFVAAVAALLVPSKPAGAAAPQSGATAGPAPGSTPAAPRSPESARQYLSRAIACVKQAGLAGVPPGVSELRMAVNGVTLPEAQQPVMYVAPGGFGVMFLIDEGDHFVYASRGDLSDAGIRAEQLHEIGLRNLVAQTSKGEGRPGLSIRQNGTFHAVLMGGNFEASLILVDALWNNDQIRQVAPNGCVIALPARDLLAFCDAGSAQGIADLKAFARRASANADHLLTPDLFVRKAGQWVRFDA
jgi:hypothetical protein